MKQKSKFRRFWNLDHRKSDGFTLIELIVVIAIMAVLAGVGTAGYGAYIESANKGADRKLVGDVMRAIQTSGNSYMADFTVEGQFSTGLQLPVGYVVLTTDGVETESDAIDKALQDAFGSNYKTSMKLKYTEWEAGTIGGSNLHNAAPTMVQKIDDTGALMIALQNLVPLTKDKYDNTGDMIVSVAGNVTSKDKAAFIEEWNKASSQPKDQVGFGLAGRENYSAVRLAYNNSFAEYVRANYEGDKDPDTLANGIANYGQSAGQLAYDEAYEIAYNKAPFLKDTAGKAAGKLAQEAADKAAPNATFPYTVTSSAFDDENFIGHGDEDIKKLYNEWLAGPAQDDAAMFYDMMTTAAKDGKDYLDKNGGDEFVNWFKDEAQAYSDNLNAVQDKVDGKSAIAIAAYYNGITVDFGVYSPEADPRNEK